MWWGLLLCRVHTQELALQAKEDAELSLAVGAEEVEGQEEQVEQEQKQMEQEQKQMEQEQKQAASEEGTDASIKPLVRLEGEEWRVGEVLGIEALARGARFR